MKKVNFILLLIVVFDCAGCSQITKTANSITESAKIIWGSSTKALENARVDALNKTYRCSLNACYAAVLNLARKEKTHLERVKNIEDAKSGEEEEEGSGLIFNSESAKNTIDANTDGYFDIFIKDRAKRHIVVMGIYGNIETTEVGIFFSQPSSSDLVRTASRTGTAGP